LGQQVSDADEGRWRQQFIGIVLMETMPMPNAYAPMSHIAYISQSNQMTHTLTSLIREENN